MGKIHTKPRVLDLFCGIGGLTLGLERSGMKSIGGIDIWEDAKKTFEHNRNPLKCMLADLATVSVGNIEDYFHIDRASIDVLAGGPPCQGFSTVGKRDAADPRNRLWKHYFELVDQIRPKYFIIENVGGMLVMKGGAIVKGIVSNFESIGYRIGVKELRSADYGIPQLRRRAVFLGSREDCVEVSFPEPTHAEGNFVTVGDAIFDLPELNPGEIEDRYFQSPKSSFQRARRVGQKILHNHEAANHPPHLVEILSHIPDGGNRKSIPDHLQPKSGFHNSYARLASFKPAVAVTSNMRKPSSARATHPFQNRGLTVREGLRLQTFDDDFVVLGSRTSQYLQVGNAVPPMLGEVIGDQVVEAFKETRKTAPPGRGRSGSRSREDRLEA